MKSYVNKQDNLAWIRFFAIVFVLLIHTSSEFALQEPLSIPWFFALAVEAVSREGLCLFFVLSGFLLIKEFYSLKDVFSFFIRRFRRIFPLFFLWSFIYYCYCNGFSLDILSFCKKVFEGPVYPHLWFIYSLFGIYIVTPFISNVLVRAKLSDIAILCFVSFLSWSLFPVFSFLNLSLSLSLSLSPWLVYFFCGYLLKIFCNRFINRISLFYLSYFYLFSVVIVFFLSFFTSNSVKPISSVFDPRPYDLNIFMAFATCSLFLILYSLFSRPLPLFVSFISEHSFGIYLSHMLFLDLYSKFVFIDFWLYDMVFKFIFVLLCSVFFEIFYSVVIMYIHGLYLKFFNNIMIKLKNIYIRY